MTDVTANRSTNGSNNDYRGVRRLWPWAGGRWTANGDANGGHEAAGTGADTDEADDLDVDEPWDDEPLLDPDPIYLLADEEADGDDELGGDGGPFGPGSPVTSDGSGGQERLVTGVKVDYLGDPVKLVNRRPTMRLRFSPVELGFHDGLAAYPDDAEGVTPSAVVALRDEEGERSAWIDYARGRAAQQLDVRIVRLSHEVELAEQRLDEAMTRLLMRHPQGARAGYFPSPEAAAAAVTEQAAILGKERADSEARDAAPGDDAGAEPDGAGPETDGPAGGESATKPDPPTDPVKLTLAQRVVASRELVWSLHPFWFWAGSLALFGAEFPFLRSVVGQLLLEQHPPEWLRLFATTSVTVGFLIGTKLSGFLLRRAQSMFLLASLIQPERRPLLVRVGRKVRAFVRKREDPTEPHVNDPTEEGLRFGAWSRLFGAGLLAAVLVFAVLAIATYRSEAARAIADEAESVSQGIGRADFSAEGGDPFGGAATDEVDEDTVLSAVPQPILQRVFLTIALLNIVCAIALAWASTKVPYEVVPEEGDGAPDSDEASELETVVGAQDEKQGRFRRKPRRAHRRREFGRRLERDVERRRGRLVVARTRLAEAEARRRDLDSNMDALKRVSRAQCLLDERRYWWANRASRKVAVEPEVDARLAEVRETTPAPRIDGNGGAR